MTTRFGAAFLALSIFLSPFSVFAEVLPLQEENVSPVSDELLAEVEPMVGEILATSTQFVEETPIEEAVFEALEPVETIDPDTYAEGELIVVFENSFSESEAEALTDTYDLTSYESLTDEGTVALVETDDAIEEVIAQLEASPQVAYVEPNYIRDIEAFTAYNIDTIDATEAWSIATGTDVVIAIIDTGVDYTHPDFAGRMWDGSNCLSDAGTLLTGCINGYDFADNDTDPSPISASTSWQHGTHVAGIAAGIAPGAKIMALRFGLTVASEIKAINFARENGVRIINASYSGETFSQAEHDAIKDFTDAGGLFVAVAGNDAEDIDTTPKYPGSYDISGIITVTATNEQDELTSISSFGDETVDLGAPGTRIRSSYPNNQYAFATGTSMAAPHVAGTIALLKQKFPLLSATDIKERVMTTGDSLPSLQSKTVSGKRVNAHRALTIDFKAPVVTLLGETSVTLTPGSVFADPGATALDDFDGDISSSIVVTGTVDTNTVGTYAIDYTVSDTQGNSATSTRTVSIQSPPASGGGGGGGGGGGKSKAKKAEEKKKAAEKKAREAAKKKAAEQAKKAKAAKQTSDPARLPQSATSTSGTVLGSITIQPPAHIFSLNLGLGSTGPEVTSLQTKLVSLGFLTATPTGYYGALTQAAVTAYQRSKNIPALGIVGPMTRAALNTQ